MTEVGDESVGCWTIARVLKWTQAHFAAKGIDTCRLDAEILLADVLGVDRVYLYTHHDRPLDNAERHAFRQRVQRRGRREPVSQILGTREFYGRSFAVDRNVLTPRPETEHVVEAVLACVGERDGDALSLLDVGTGSGVLALTLVLELPASRVLATDICEQALGVAQCNAERLGVAAQRVRFMCGDLFAAVGDEAFDIVVSNPPYIATADRETLAPEVRDFEPERALFGGMDGLAVLRAIIEQAGSRIKPDGVLVLEIGAGQHEQVEAMLAARWSRVWHHNDLQGIPRVVCAQ